ncbi:hypothetical protein EBB05_23100 [Methylobacterium brachiatum]|nr:hypothetical protein EBB05_23100 [Methylobacterium brachiatum]
MSRISAGRELPPPFAGEGGPRRGSGEGSNGAEENVGLHDGCAFPGTGAPLSRPGLTAGPPSPAEGGGRGACRRPHDLTPPPRPGRPCGRKARERPGRSPGGG